MLKLAALFSLMEILGALGTTQNPRSIGERNPTKACPSHTPEPSSKCTKFSGNANTNPSGPLLDAIRNGDDFADPRCLYHEGTYYAYATNNYGINKTNVPLATSHEFNTGWSYVNYHDTLPDPGSWTKKDENGNAIIWDPSVFYVEGKFVMYYAAELPTTSGSGTSRCAGAAVADNPRGPFKATKEPLICSNPVTEEHHYISPYLVQHDGHNYLVIKNKPTGGEKSPSKIQLFDMSSDGLRNTSGPVTLYTSTAADWDAEGPSIVYNNGIFFLMYVINYYENPGYATHYVTSTNGIHGPYKTPGKVFLETGIQGPDDVYLLGPGGPSFFNNTHLMLMTTAPMAENCTRGNYDIRGPRVATVKYAGQTISLA